MLHNVLSKNYFPKTRKKRVKNKKQIILKEEPLHMFIDNSYLPMLGKYTYHLSRVILLEKIETSADRSKNLRPGNINTFRENVERLVFEKGKRNYESTLWTPHITLD